jgi:nucleoside-diphosphate-sugar epimerase
MSRRLMEMKIVIADGTGFVGKALTPLFLSQQHDI